MKSQALGLALAALSAAAAVAQDQPAVPCTITDGNQLDAAATCEVLREDPVTEFKGTIEENGAKFTAVANADEGTGVLIGAGTFFLADGELETIEDGKLAWPNGYVVILDE